jgi:hypothetical protein
VYRPHAIKAALTTTLGTCQRFVHDDQFRADAPRLSAAEPARSFDDATLFASLTNSSPAALIAPVGGVCNVP